MLFVDAPTLFEIRMSALYIMTEISSGAIIFLLVVFDTRIFGIIVTKDVWMIAAFFAAYFTWQLNLNRWSDLSTKYLRAGDDSIVCFPTRVHYNSIHFPPLACSHRQYFLLRYL